MSRYSHILWDWNGTLIDDAWLGVAVMNEMLEKKKLPTITVDYYRAVFGFPVRDYYRQLGFSIDEDPVWEEVANDFISGYHRRMHEVQLFPDAVATLAALKERGVTQIILSAMEQKTLTRHVAALGIADYFNHVQGIDNHYADGKGHMAQALGERLGVDPKNILFVGDPLHDIEAARRIGCDCLICARGHQSKERLLAAGVPVVDRFDELTKML